MSLGSVPCPGPGSGESNLIKHGTLTLLHCEKILAKLVIHASLLCTHLKMKLKLLKRFCKIENYISVLLYFLGCLPMVIKCLWLIPDSNLCEHNKSGAGSAYLLRAGGTI